jgi:hypothetical protein
MFALFALGSSQTWAANYTRRTAAEFSKGLWANISLDNYNPDKDSPAPPASLSLDDYNADSDRVSKYCYVVRSAGEPTSGWNYTYFYVTGTKQEIAELNASIASIFNNREEIGDCEKENGSAPVAFVILKAEASEAQVMTFWVNIVVWVIFIGFALAAFLLWHSDNYAKDPLYSLLFVTDGNRLVTGE